ncbi:MAG TPA: helix-turn-helix transcriptional regulator [Longimicrobiaceae bacterium]
MSDLTNYTRKRAARDAHFAEGLESGYADFKIGARLRQAREQAGLTQEELAARLETKKSAISRIENHAGDIRLSTLVRYARALGQHLSLELQPARPRKRGSVVR